MNYRNRKLLDCARGMPCMVQLDCCNHDSATTVAAHSNLSAHGKGMSIKASDCFWAASCSACHHAMDHGNWLTRAEREYYWRAAHDRTMLYLWTHGLIKVA